jgi:hypothetical protein
MIINSVQTPRGNATNSHVVNIVRTWEEGDLCIWLDELRLAIRMPSHELPQFHLRAVELSISKSLP